MRRPLFTVALCLVFLCAIRLWAGGTEYDGGSSEWEYLAQNGSLLITGQVYQKEEDSIYLKSITISDSNAFGQSAAVSRQVYSSNHITDERGESISGNLVCKMDGAMYVPLGSTVLVRGTFVPFLGATNPGQFDARKYYRSIGIVGKLEDTDLLGQSVGCWSVREWLCGVKVWLQEHIHTIFQEEDAAVIEALLLGEKGNLDRDLKGLYRRNGILHILSISAMHVSIVGMLFYGLLRKLGVPVWLAALCGSVVLVLYGALTGFGISVVRAIGMYLLRMLGEIVGRTYDMLTALGLVGVLMVLYNPYYLENGGFLLSFSCVLGIGVLYPALLPDWKRYVGKNRALDTLWKKGMERIRQAQFPRQIVNSFILSLSVTLATLPVQLMLYYEVPVFGVFLNLLVIPFLKPLMVSGITALVLPGSVVFEGVVHTILGWYEFACGFFDRLSCNTWNPGCPAGWQVVVYYGLLLAVIWWRRRVKADDKLSLCGLVLVAGVFVLNLHPLRSSITFLDVGQGSCAVLRLSSGENYLFDCGSTGQSKVGEYVLLPYLKYAGIHRMDGVFVSHPDDDHCSGVLELFALAGENDIVVEQLILPDIEDKASEEQMKELLVAAGEIRVATISRGDTWQCDGTRFLCLHPYRDYSGADSNQYSTCIYVEFEERKWICNAGTSGSLLLTGDVGKRAEKDLLEALGDYGIGNVTVLQGAHHGSKYSNSKELLEMIQPEVTVISCGRNNSYGHPHEETLDRLEEVGSVILTTPEHGAIYVEFGRKIRVSGCTGRKVGL